MDPIFFHREKLQHREHQVIEIDLHLETKIFPPPVKYSSGKSRGVLFCTPEWLRLGELHLHTQELQRLMKAEMSQGPAC